MGIYQFLKNISLKKYNLMTISEPNIYQKTLLQRNQLCRCYLSSIQGRTSAGAALVELCGLKKASVSSLKIILGRCWFSVLRRCQEWPRLGGYQKCASSVHGSDLRNQNLHCNKIHKEVTCIAKWEKSWPGASPPTWRRIGSSFPPPCLPSFFPFQLFFLVQYRQCFYNVQLKYITGKQNHAIYDLLCLFLHLTQHM